VKINDVPDDKDDVDNNDKDDETRQDEIGWGGKVWEERQSVRVCWR